ncbi:MAG TPA: DUF4595 domain-containing protein [Puia sp.]|nr:DUF4595 domain-containing protein [Puia sp.]
MATVSETYSNTSSQVGFALTYGSDDKLSKVIASTDGITSLTKTYTYSGKKIYIATDVGANSSTDTVTLNDAGMVALDKLTTNISVFITTYSYNSNGELQSVVTQQDNYPPSTTVYTFLNGDAVKLVTGTDTDVLGYDLNKLSVLGDLNDFHQLYYLGAFYLKNKHLVTSSKDDPNSVTYSYTYDSDGKITSVIYVNGSITTTRTYTYTCK